MIARSRPLRRRAGSGSTPVGAPARLAAGLGAAALALGAGGCAGATNSLDPPVQTVRVAHSTALGKVLVDREGRTLYTFVADGRNRSTCFSACAAVWPPATTASANAVSGPGARGLATLRRPDGAIQLTYGGRPLYYYQGDTQPAQTTGDAVTQFGAQWYALTPAAPVARVEVAGGRLGPMLVTGDGRALYLFERDTGPRSTCYGSCAAIWPPATTSGTPAAGAGASASLVATTRRRDGTPQLLYHGHPLYYYSVDQKAGATQGQELTQFGGKWYAVRPDGSAIP